MQANPDDRMDRLYQDLTEKQRAVIDAHAQHPEATNRKKAKVAGEEILGEDGPVNESYCSEILNKKFSDLAQYRAEIEQNERASGDEQTVGDPFANIQSGEGSWQTIDERPTKVTSDESGNSEPQETADMLQEPVQRVQPVQVADTGDGIAIKLSYRYVQSLLESQEAQLPENLHEQLVDVVLQRAFN